MCKEPYFIAQCHILFNTEKVKQVKTTQERKKESIIMVHFSLQPMETSPVARAKI